MMAAGQKVRILEQEQPVCEVPLNEPLELGRQRAGEPEPYQLLPAGEGGPIRLVIAHQHDKENISRRHLTLTPLSEGRVRVSNHSQADLDCPQAGKITPGAAVDLEPPFTLELPSRSIRVEQGDSADEHGVHSPDSASRRLAAGLLSSPSSVARADPPGGLFFKNRGAKMPGRVNLG
jgi:hypothetical protein